MLISHMRKDPDPTSDPRKNPATVYPGDSAIDKDLLPIK
jgi:hypothetical protein